MPQWRCGEEVCGVRGGEGDVFGGLWREKVGRVMPREIC